VFAGSLLPGTLVNARVKAVLSDGLQMSFLTYFTGTVDPFHLGQVRRSLLARSTIVRDIVWAGGIWSRYPLRPGTTLLANAIACKRRPVDCTPGRCVIAGRCLCS
jgi:hypothetical protein